ncbi:hypothetical protein [uncultured Prochlorococcus sp.]|uniref:hypothetical protein n=1 Tax=uncultured Prochlorococcus sp. TaxID=159733 RepID=UPI00258B7E43|nr:hypothetical protein [uncultured Prochlorococcus sp.]
MSNQSDPFSNPINIKNIQAIDCLDLPTMQKHHVRILAHCLQILKTITAENIYQSSFKNQLREWCENQSKQFDDKKFSELFYKQLESTANKLNTFSQKIGKNIQDLDIKDLVLLVEQDQESI